jgi:hypothetical protein
MVMRAQRKWEDVEWGGSETGLMLQRLIACDANGDDWLRRRRWVRPSYAAKGWHFKGLLAAGGINKERFKRGGILKVCRKNYYEDSRTTTKSENAAIGEITK